MENTNNTTTNNTSEIIERSRLIINTTESLIMEMSDQHREPLKALATRVGIATNLEPSRVLPYVVDFCHSTSLGYVSAGRFGGFCRGTKKSKIVKTQKSLEMLINDEE